MPQLTRGVSVIVISTLWARTPASSSSPSNNFVIRSERAEHVCDRGVEVDVGQHCEQLSFLVPEVRLHDGGDALQMPADLGRRGLRLDDSLQLCEQVRDHGV